MANKIFVLERINSFLTNLLHLFNLDQKGMVEYPCIKCIKSAFSDI